MLVSKRNGTLDDLKVKCSCLFSFPLSKGKRTMDCRGSEEPAGLRVLMSFRNVEHEWSRKQNKKIKQIKLLQLDLDHITS